MDECPSCNMSKPAEWCWNNNYTCPLGYPPRHVDVRALLQLIRLLQERVTALEQPPPSPTKGVWEDWGSDDNVRPRDDVYDIAVNSMDFGSGFLSTEEVNDLRNAGTSWWRRLMGDA